MPGVKLAHPSPDQLAAYDLGKLSEKASATVEAHLQGCEPCQRRLAGLPGRDSLIDLLKKPMPASCTETQASAARNPAAPTPTAGGKQATSQSSAAGALSGQFGRYRILKPLGQGGMGAVYLAHDSQLDRQVALKVPKFGPEDGDDVLERFYREAKAAATIEHPNLCPVHDVGAINGIHYLTMAYVEGKTLAEVIKAGKPLPQPQAAAVVRKLALALQEAHGKGVIHRDLKPANIMINQRREPVIMDFGLAKRLPSPGRQGGDAPLTQSGMMMGTPAYMPPEQVDGDLKRMGPGCDIYSLGVILYELLAGRRPFDGSMAAIIGKIMTQDPEPLSHHRPDVDPRLEAICLRAMMKKVGERYGSMKEMAGTLGEYLKETSQSAGTQTKDAAAQVFADLVAAPRIITHPPKKQRTASGGKGRWPRWGWIAAAGGAAAALIIAGVIIVIHTSSGKITFETDDPNARVEIRPSFPPATSPKLKEEEPKPPPKKPNPEPPAAVPETKAEQPPKGGDSPSDAAPAKGQMRAAAMRFPYVYILDNGIYSPRDLWVFKLPNTSPPEAKAPQPIARLVRSTGEENTKELLNERLPLLKIQESFRITDAGNGHDLLIVGDTLLCPRSGALEVYSLEDPAKPRHRGRFGPDRGAETFRMVQHGGYLFLLNRKQLTIFDITEPRTPSFIKSITAKSELWSGCVVGNYLYVGLYDHSNTNQEGIGVYDVTDPRNPKDVGRVQAWKSPYHLLPTRGRKIVALMDERMQLFTLTDPLKPAPVGNLIKASGARVGAFLSTDEEYLITGYDVFKIRDDEISSVSGYPSGGNASGFPHHAATEGPYVVIPTDRGAVVLLSAKKETGKAPQTSSQVQVVPTTGPQIVRDCQVFQSKGEVWSTVFTPDKGQIISAHGGQLIDTVGGKKGFRTSVDCTVRFREINTGKETANFPEMQARVTCMAFTPDGRSVVFGSDDKNIRLWDYNPGQAAPRSLTLAGHTDSVSSIAVFRDSKHAVSVSWDKTLRLWDLASQSELKAWTDLDDRLTAVVLGQDERLAIIAGWKGLYWWDLEKGNLIRHVRTGGSLYCLARSADGSRLLTGGLHGEVILVDADSGQTLRKIKAHAPGFGGEGTKCIAFSPNGQYALSGSADRTVRLWDLSTEKELCRFEGHTERVNTVGFSSDGSTVISGGGDGTVRLWKIPRLAIEVRRFEGHTNWVTSVAVSTDGRHLVSGSYDKTVRLWELETGREVQRFDGHDSYVWSVAISADGTQVLSGSLDKSVILWGLGTGKLVSRFNGHTTDLRAVTFSPDGRQALSASTPSPNGNIFCWDVLTGAEIRRFTGGICAAFSPDGRLAFTSAFTNKGGELVAWRTDTWEEVGRFKGHATSIHEVALSRDGRRLVTGGFDCTVRIWDVETRQQIKCLEGHANPVVGVAISPDGRRVLSCAGKSDKDADRSVRLWDADSGTEICRLEGHTDYVTSVAFTPDGQHAVTGSWDKTIYLWRLPDLSASAAPQSPFTWPADALREGRIKAPDLSKAKVLLDERFDDPTSGFPQGKARTGGGIEYERGYRDKKYFYKTLKRDGECWVGERWLGDKRLANFACEVTARVNGSPDGGWGLAISGGSRSINVYLNGAGRLHIETRGGDIKHESIKSDSRTLLIIVRGRRLEAYVDSVAVCQPILLENEFDNASVTLNARVGNLSAEVEFERITIYSAEGLPTPEERAASLKAGSASNLLDRSLQALGGIVNLTKPRAMTSKLKGTCWIANQPIPFTGEEAIQPPDRYRQTVDYEVQGAPTKVKASTIINGDTAWFKTNDRVQVGDKRGVAMFQEVLGNVCNPSGVLLKLREATQSPVEESKLDGRAVLVVRGERDHPQLGRGTFAVFVAKDTALPLKAEVRYKHLMADKEVFHEHFWDAYQAIDGVQHVTRFSYKIDGKFHYEKAERFDIRYVDKLDEGLFAKP